MATISAWGCGKRTSCFLVNRGYAGDFAPRCVQENPLEPLTTVGLGFGTLVCTRTERPGEELLIRGDAYSSNGEKILSRSLAHQAECLPKQWLTLERLNM